MFTELNYMYRDASNYKEGTTLYFEGAVTAEQRAAISAALDSGLYFIPDDVGLEELQSRLTSFPSEDDHVWHELESLNVVKTLPADAVVEGPVEDMVETFRKVGPHGWDVARAMDRLDLEA
jgi:hypothetical protein